MKILLDSNSIPFLYKYREEIKTYENFVFYILPSQKREIEKQLGTNKKQILKDTIKIHDVEATAGVFFLNVPNVNVPSYFVNGKTEKHFKQVLLQHNCLHKGQENFLADFDIAYSAFCNKYVVLTNDGAGKKDGLYKALKELNIECLSHEEFLKML